MLLSLFPLSYIATIGQRRGGIIHTKNIWTCHRWNKELWYWLVEVWLDCFLLSSCVLLSFVVGMYSTGMMLLLVVAVWTCCYVLVVLVGGVLLLRIKYSRDSFTQPLLLLCLSDDCRSITLWDVSASFVGKRSAESMRLLVSGLSFLLRVGVPCLGPVYPPEAFPFVRPPLGRPTRFWHEK